MTGYKLSKRLLLLSAALTMALSQSTFAAETVKLDLDDAMQRAFATNPSISIADYQLKSARASYNAARQSHGISISANHQTQRSGMDDNQYTKAGWTFGNNGEPKYVPSINTGKGIHNSHANTISATLPIYTGGQLRGAAKQAKANYLYNKVGVQRAWNEMRSTVTNGYFTMLQTDNLQKLNRESVERLTDHLKNVQAQYDVGVVAKVDVLRSQVELANAQQSLIQAENNYQIAEANMNKIVGLPLDTKLELNNLLVYNPYDKTMEECLAYSTKHRPELEQAKQNVEAAKGSLMAARSGHMPKVYGNASKGWSSSNWPGDENGDWAVGVSVSMNVFDSGVTLSKIHGAEADLKQAEETYRNTVDSVNLDVRTNYLGLREAEKRINTTKLAVEQADEDYRIAQLRYQNGVGTNTDVLDAQVALTQAQTNYLQALYDFNTSKTDLETAIGVPMVNPVKVTVVSAEEETETVSK